MVHCPLGQSLFASPYASATGETSKRTKDIGKNRSHPDSRRGNARSLGLGRPREGGSQRSPSTPSESRRRKMINADWSGTCIAAAPLAE